MSTGNLTRDEFIVRAIKECIACHEPPEQIGFVTDKLPRDFDLTDDELADALREIKLGGESLESVGDAPADDTEGLKPSSPQAVPDAPVIPHAQARAAVEKAHKRLGEARAAVITARNKLADTKGALALAITGWQTHSDPLTPEQRRQQEVRNHLASEQARKQRLADAGQATTRMDTRKFPAQNMVTGAMGHKGNTRGAYPREYQHRTVKQPGAKA
jgi:hypothetical protein